MACSLPDFGYNRGMTSPRRRRQILLTNDDGILSPGLWAAAAALQSLGFVTVAAPRRQYSSAGRSLPIDSDGIIERRTVTVGDQDWEVFAIGGSPAQAVMHAVLEIMPTPPDLVVSGINYGENAGSGVTISGTVGAALEAASLGIPGMAVSLQLQNADDYLSYSRAVDFSTAAHFTQLFAARILAQPLPPDVDILKVEVPVNATPETPWELTRQSRHRYYVPLVRRKDGWDQPARLDARIDVTPETAGQNTDVHALLRRVVSVTPLSIDLTSRTDLTALESRLNG